MMNEKPNEVVLKPASPTTAVPPLTGSPNAPPSEPGSTPALFRPDGTPFDAAAERVKALAHAERYIEIVDSVQSQQAGTWCNVPPNLRNWLFWYAGRKDNPAHVAAAEDLCRIGWSVAPRGVYAKGFESVGEAAINLCAPPEFSHVMRSLRAMKQRERLAILQKDFGSSGQHQSMLRDAAGRHAQVEHISTVQFGKSRDDLLSELRYVQKQLA